VRFDRIDAVDGAGPVRKLAAGEGSAPMSAAKSAQYEASFFFRAAARVMSGNGGEGMSEKFLVRGQVNLPDIYIQQKNPPILPRAGS
jgi:hypothetical protein